MERRFSKKKTDTSGLEGETLSRASIMMRWKKRKIVHTQKRIKAGSQAKGGREENSKKLGGTPNQNKRRIPRHRKGDRKNKEKAE